MIDRIAETSGSKIELDESGKAAGKTNDVEHPEEWSASTAKIKGRGKREKNKRATHDVSNQTPTAKCVYYVKALH